MDTAPRRDDTETFAEFKDSFSYGDRNDLLFKFLKNLSAGDAADFLQRLLQLLGDAVDTDRLEPVVKHLFEGQVKAYLPKSGAPPFHWKYDHAPMARLRKPLAKARIALVTSSGHFVDGDDPSPFGIPGGVSLRLATRHPNDMGMHHNRSADRALQSSSGCRVASRSETPPAIPRSA